MKIILVNVEKLSVKTMNIDWSLKKAYELINCSTVTGTYAFGDIGNNVVYADDEGLYTQRQGIILDNGEVLFGNLVITGIDEEGDSCDCSISTVDIITKINRGVINPNF